jgi:hypothetical protein
MKNEQNRKILISAAHWNETWLGLRDRSTGGVESVAVWAGKRISAEETVQGVYFLDDCEDGIQHARYHQVSPETLAALFDRLRNDRRVIIGDVHTHPSRWVDLSDLDKENPIEFRRQVLAVVLPEYAKSNPSLASAGIHEYLGDGHWKTLSLVEKHQLITFI